MNGEHILLHQDGAPPLRQLPSNRSNDAQAVHGAHTTSVRFHVIIHNQRADESGLFSHSDLFLSPRKRLLWDANTSSSGIFTYVQ